MTEAKHDPEEAARYARTWAHRTAPGCQHRLGCRCTPPHWLRCEWMFEGERCRLGDSHFGPHEFIVARTP